MENDSSNEATSKELSSTSSSKHVPHFQYMHFMKNLECSKNKNNMEKKEYSVERISNGIKRKRKSHIITQAKEETK